MGDKGGFYNWYGLKYFLYEYELDKMKLSGQRKVDWELFVKNEKDKISIEHIFPQTSTPYWDKAFDDVPKEQRHLYTGSLGNLLLLSGSINSSLQNDSFPEKLQPKINDKGETTRKGYKDGSHSEIEVSLKYPQWTKTEIEKRGMDLIQFMENRWEINFPNDDEKKKLLQIELTTVE
jgi:hypothetical protein